MVEALGVQQALVRALLDDLAVADHHDLVGVADGAQAVSNDQAGASVQQTRKSPASANASKSPSPQPISSNRPRSGP